MKNKFEIIRVCILWTFVCLGMSGMNGAQKNNFAMPDFAFPKEVSENAKSELNKSLRNGDGVTALRAAMQIVIADDLVSEDNLKQGVVLLDSLSAILKSPYSDIALLLEADLLGDAYKADRWTYNNRVLPLTPYPEDIKAWSRDQFEACISNLIQRAIAGKDEMRGKPLSAIAPILTDYGDAEKCGMDLYDFAVVKAYGILNAFRTDSETIPFLDIAGSAKSGAALGREILDGDILENEKEGKLELSSLLCELKLNSLTGEERIAWNKKCYDTYRRTPWGAVFVLNKVAETSDDDNFMENYEVVNDYLLRFPDCRYSSRLKSYLDNKKLERADVQGKEQYLPGMPISGTANVRNLSSLHLLLVKLPDSYLGKSVKKETIEAAGRIIASELIEGSADIPSNLERDFTFAGVESGVYAFVPSRTADKSGIIWNVSKNYSIPTFLVSSLSIVQMSDRRRSDGSALYVVEGENQRPVKGAKVVFTPAYKWKNSKVVTAVSDSEGRVTLPAGSYNVRVTSGKNLLESSAYTYTNKEEEKEMLRGEVLTDLSIYHPGDTVGFSAIAYTSLGEKLKAATGRNLRIMLMDANWQAKDTVTLVTDNYGRAEGYMVLPESGLLWNWHLQLTDEKNNWCGETTIRVEEYKAPTFYVETQGGDGEYATGDKILIRGVAKTYSGMPVSGAPVKYSVNYRPLWWRDSGGPATYGGDTETGPDGKFVIELPTDGLKGTRFAFGNYSFIAEVTSPSGETQQSVPLHFSLGEAWRLQASVPGYVDADNFKGNITCAVYDIAGFPTKKQIFYRVEEFKTKKIVAQGEFESPVLPLKVSQLPSGAYRVIFSQYAFDSDVSEDKRGIEERKMVVYRADDRTPAEETCLWLPEEKIIVSPTDEEVLIRVGSSYPDSFILAEIADTHGIKEKRWVKVSQGIVSFPVKAPAVDSRLRVTFAGMRDLEGSVRSVTLIPARQIEQLEIECESFRDKSTPGARERFTFRFMLGGKTQGNLPVMAVMSNKALNALSPFKWNLNPDAGIGWYFPADLSQSHSGNYHWGMYFSRTPDLKYAKDFEWPSFEKYGYSLYGGSGLNGIRIRGARKMAASNTKEIAVSEVLDEVYVTGSVASATFAAGVIEDSAEMEEDAADSGSGETSVNEEEPLRQIDYPSAFFMPELVTDSYGRVNVDFVMPDFNGTWQFQIAGYTPEMKGNVWIGDIVASKAVMASLNAPRFVRTGDKVVFEGIVYNNTDLEASLSARIVVYDPLTGQEYAVREFAADSVSAMGNRTVSLSYNVPSSIEVVGVKLYGMQGTHKDGEQVIIPVYPSSTPVIEAQTFVLAPGQKDFSLRIAEIGKGVNTLTYTDNPVWECITALPAIITPESENAMSLVNALYGNAIGRGLLNEYPQLSEALRIMNDPANASDSTLVSALERNEALKAVTLDNTPWVNNAQSQTLRMSRLQEYLDLKTVDGTIDKLIIALKKLQNPDGGWSWCESMESSPFITRYVLSRLAMLSKAGYLPKEATSMAAKGFEFADHAYVNEVKKIGIGKYPYASVADYLYIRQSFGNVKTSAGFEDIKNRCLSSLASSWKKMDIYGKATAAILLRASRRSEIVGKILKSLLEYSSYQPEKGRWYDNLMSSGRVGSEIETTARVLEAFATVEPTVAAVDQLREWLLLALRTGDMNAGSRETTSMLHSILTTGSNWTGDAETAKIFVGGREIESDRMAKLTGSVTITLPSGIDEIRIERNAEGPAWGGVISQYVEEIENVKGSKVSELSISKEIFKISVDADGSSASFGEIRPGDKVRVTLTLKNDRALEYVTITDSRAACLEPTDQVSGYSASDGIGMYREVRDSSTNLFIPYLPKGTHVISYDCYVDRAGEYTLGIATAQSQYTPEIVAHSSGKVIKTD